MQRGSVASFGGSGGTAAAYIHHAAQFREYAVRFRGSGARFRGLRRVPFFRKHRKKACKNLPPHGAIFFENDVSRAEGAFAAPSGCLQGRLPPCILFIHFLVVTGQRCGNARHHLKRFGNALSQPDQLFICLRRDRFIVPSCMLERCSRLSPVPLTTQEIASSATRVSMPV